MSSPASIKSVSTKMGIKLGSRAFFVNAPIDAIEAIHLPELDLGSSLDGKFDYIHFFVTSQAELDERFPELKSHLNQTGMLWVSWPKAKQQNTDLTLIKVIEIGYTHGLVESKTLSVNSVWSAIKFTFPKPGKTYQNSYGKLLE